MNNNNNNEIWKDILGYEHKYKISNYGNVQATSITKNTTKHRILKPPINKLGYEFVLLISKENHNSTMKTFTIHELVASHFITKPNNSNNVVIHINNNKRNNHYTNLKYVDFDDKSITQSNLDNRIKMIYQFNMQYNFIKKWQSMSEILENNATYKLSAIANNLCAINKSAYNYRWSYNETIS